MRVMALAATLVVSGCSILNPVVVDCHLQERCAEVVAVANRVLPQGAERVSVNIGRSRQFFHAEVHACYPDGRYVLVDVFDDGQGNLDPSIRSDGWADPPCR